MKGTYLERYLESISSLPSDVNRNFAEIRARDLEVNELSSGVDETLESLAKKPHLSEEDENTVLQCKAKLIKCKNLTDEKVALATQAYEWIERSIAALDSELKKFEAELSEKKKHGTTLPQKKKISNTNTPAKGPNASTSNNEETKKYCICNKESFGEMIECENKDCDIGWFHFGCVGLKEVPKGTWYCERCRKLKEKEKERERQKKAEQPATK